MEYYRYRISFGCVNNGNKFVVKNKRRNPLYVKVLNAQMFKIENTYFSSGLVADSPSQDKL